MNYLLLIYGDEQAGVNMSKEDMDEMMGAYNAYTEDLQKAGIMRGGDALHPTSSATTVRVQDGKKVTTHGPFAETKEQLGGYYWVDCKNLDEAIEWAAKCPGAHYGSIEVRPVVDFSQPQ
ncbi:MAG: YciI family protein [Roseiflexaceae bacterium]|jgi:hypothetical protein